MIEAAARAASFIIYAAGTFVSLGATEAFFGKLAADWCGLAILTICGVVIFWRSFTACTREHRS